MNKQDLIGAVADASGLSRADAAKAVEAIFESIADELRRGGDVRLVGFGTFTTAKRPASSGRNPRTGEPMQISASTQAKFKPGKPSTAAAAAVMAGSVRNIDKARGQALK